MENEKMDAYTLKIIRHELNNSLARMLFIIDEIVDKELKVKLEKEVSLINEFLNESNGSEANLVSIDLLRLIKDILGPKSSIELFSDFSDFTVLGQQTIIRHILENLVTNAHKYSDGEIKIMLTKEGKAICFEISNNGDKLLEEELGSLFDYGFRGSNSKYETGEGVGLYYAKKLANNAGYELSYKFTNQHVFRVIFK